MTRRKLGVSPLFIPSNASFGTHHPFFEFHSYGERYAPVSMLLDEAENVLLLKRSVSRLYHRRGTFDVQRNFIPGE